MASDGRVAPTTCTPRYPGEEEIPGAGLSPASHESSTAHFPACSFHQHKTLLEARDGITEIKFSRPISPYSFVSGSSSHPQHRHRLYRWDQIGWTIHRLSRLKSLRTQVLLLVDLVHQRVDLLCPCWSEPVRKSPRTMAYGSFTYGTVPHHPPCFSRFLSPSATFASRLPRPTRPPFARPRSLSPRFRYYADVRLLAELRSPLRFYLL